jgi:hypothetical protein
MTGTAHAAKRPASHRAHGSQTTSPAGNQSGTRRPERTLAVQVGFPPGRG